MIFNSLLNLINDNKNNVYKFICKFFYENNVQLNNEDCKFITEKLNDFSISGQKDFHNFIKLFEDNKKLYDLLKELDFTGKYGCFTNNKRVYISTLDGVTLSLTIFYIKTFGYSNIEN